MEFTYYIIQNENQFNASQFSFTQTGVVHREVSMNTGTNNYIDSTGLDNIASANPFVDAPAMGIIPSNDTSVSASDNYALYLMFRHDAGSVSVPLLSVGWNWGASASINNAWQPVSPQYPNLNLNTNPDFPKWTNHLDPQTSTSHSP